MKIKYLIFMLYFSVPGIANAASFDISLPGFNGSYVYPEAAGIEAFDFGVQFSSIQKAELLIEASGTSGLLESCNGSACSVSTFGQDLFWGFINEKNPTPKGALDLENVLMPFTIDITPESDFLLDGNGELSIESNLIFSIPELTITILTPPTYQISNVVLHVEGTVVPLPPALLLFMSGIGLFALNGKKLLRKNRR
ncbi:MAG TPA: hypothetical protein ENJ08_15605 [Gammaproteobacteria bacterium]|nr:hypothetical protein [Gammaproteobacteria bacterium]